MTTVYRVEIELEAKGDLNKALGDTISKLEAANASVGKFYDTLADGAGRAVDKFTGIVEKTAMIAAGFGAMGVAWASAAVHEGVVHLNAELEGTKLSMAAIFNAQGYAGSMSAALGLAGDQLDKMRQDAKRLPGEFADLANIMKTIAISAGHAGASTDRMRQMSAQFMAVGSVAGLPLDMVAREAAQLLEGRAGAHNVLGMRMAGLSGEKATSFNALSGDKRLEFLTKELGKYDDAIDTYAQSFRGLSSTFSDNLGIAKQMATQPLFEHVKGTLSSINKWFDENQVTVSYWAYRIGESLAAAWDWGVAKVNEWEPLALDFARQTKNELVDGWRAIEPVVANVAHMVKSSLGDGRAMDGIKSVLELYVLAKVGGPAMGMAAHAGGTLLNFGLAGGFGGGGAAGLAGAAGLVGGTGLLSVGAAGVATVALAVGAAAVAGQLSALANAQSVHHEEAVLASTQLASAFDSLHTGLKVSIIPAFESLGVFATKFAGDVVTGVNDLVNAKETLRIAASDIFPGYKEYQEFIARKMRMSTDDDPLLSNPARYDPFPGSGPKPYGPTSKDEKKPPKPPIVNVTAKVEINVSGNHDPMRIARMVKTEFLNEMRHPKVSSAPHYMMPR